MMRHHYHMEEVYADEAVAMTDGKNWATGGRAVSRAERTGSREP